MLLIPFNRNKTESGRFLSSKVHRLCQVWVTHRTKRAELRVKNI